MPRNKYGAVRTRVDGHVFDSKAEARRYGELQLMLRAGEIRDLRLHPAYPLMGRKGPLTYQSGRAVRYEADFEYVKDGAGVVIEDVKGVVTDAFKLKRAIMADMGLTVTVVK